MMLSVIFGPPIPSRRTAPPRSQRGGAFLLNQAKNWGTTNLGTANFGTMGRNAMIGWVVGLFLGLALATAGIICIVETVVLRPATDLPPREQGPD